ncbi:MAG: hypothetical protein V2G50_07080 [bacterium JZ-2024 1]
MAEILVTGGLPPYSWSRDGNLVPDLSFNTERMFRFLVAGMDCPAIFALLGYDRHRQTL